MIVAERRASIARFCRRGSNFGAFAIAAAALLIPPSAQAVSRSAKPLVEAPRRQMFNTDRGLMIMAENNPSPVGSTEMATAKALTTKVLAIGTWTAKATPESRPAIMPAEALDTMRLMLAGKIDPWFAKNDGSGAAFPMNVNDPAKAHTLLAQLPLGSADMMTYQLIPLGLLWPLGMLLGEPTK